jgi:two-component system LytT family sensor kinase
MYGLIWLLLTPVVFWLAVNVELTTGPRGQLLALLVHAAASVGFTVFFRGVYVAELVLVGAPDIVFSWAMVLASVNVWLPGYWMLLCVCPRLLCTLSLPQPGRGPPGNAASASLSV